MATYTPRAYVEVSRFGAVYLFNIEGYWIGPGLGYFRSAKDAKAWGRKNGYVVAHKIRHAIAA
jgi:hypothetical protein